jgi:hypothetical protein
MTNAIWKIVVNINGEHNEHFFFNKNNAISKSCEILNNIKHKYRIDEKELDCNIKVGDCKSYKDLNNDIKFWLKEIKIEDSPGLLVKLPDKGFLKAEIGADPDYPSIITSYSLDGEDCIQDLCRVEQKRDKKDIDIYVWADVNDENYTCKYEVGKFNEELWL